MRGWLPCQGTPVYYMCNNERVETRGAGRARASPASKLEALVADGSAAGASSRRGWSCTSRPSPISSASDSGWTSTGSSGWSGRGSRPTVRLGSITPSSRRTAWWPASWNGAGRKHCEEQREAGGAVRSVPGRAASATDRGRPPPDRGAGQGHSRPVARRHAPRSRNGKRSSAAWWSGSPSPSGERPNGST